MVIKNVFSLGSVFLVGTLSLSSAEKACTAHMVMGNTSCREHTMLDFVGISHSKLSVGVAS